MFLTSVWLHFRVIAGFGPAQRNTESSGALARMASMNQLFKGERKGAGAGTVICSSLVLLQDRVQRKAYIIEVNRSPHTG